MTTATAPAQGQFAPAAVATGAEMLFIGLDLGTRFGFAVLNEVGARLVSGTWTFGKTPGRHPGERVNFAQDKIAAFVREYAKRLEPGRVRLAYELARRHEGVEAAHVYGGLQWLVLAEAAANYLTAETVEVSEVKRAALGVGGGKRAGKGSVLAAARERWGSVQDDNEADALFIAEVLRRRVTGAAW